MILGLDISTTIVGIAVIDSEGKLLVSDHWDISKVDSLFEKAEVIGSSLWELKGQHNIESVFIETALKKFFPGPKKFLNTL